ncbi:MFS transporter [Pseudolysinimonas kribbensis]|uniref:MFS transporter n=1 Tax=Pseudolysinimonas kribbensis TaxID=433641 RepID=UPI0031D135F8
MSTETPAPPTGIWTGSLLWMTLGANAIIFLAAFDALAVTTIMPTVARDLDGATLYSAAFSSTLAAGVIGTVASGAWADRRGPVAPLVAAVAVFVGGLVVAATAGTMPLFVVGRFLQGLGMGAAIVAIYVIVARVYPARVHTRVFATFAAAWVVPGLVGPVAAGAVADGPGWRWVFVGVSVFVIVALVAIGPSLRRLRGAPIPATDGEVARPPASAARIARDLVLATLLAFAVVGISTAEELPTWVGWIVAAGCVVAAILLFRPVLPRGTLTARRGLGSTILLRGAIAASFFSTEVRLPYLLQAHYGMKPWEAGLILTVGAVSWGAASVLQPRLAGRVSETRALIGGALLLVLGIGLQLATAALTLHPAVVGVGWLIAAGGMGTIYPRLSTMMLGYSAPADQGFNSSALSNIESVGGATAIALGGLLFAAAGGTAGAGFSTSILLSFAIAVLAVPIAFRAEHPREAARVSG